MFDVWRKARSSTPSLICPVDTPVSMHELFSKLLLATYSTHLTKAKHRCTPCTTTYSMLVQQPWYVSCLPVQFRLQVVELCGVVA
jgi:hypothetical protein